MKTLTLLALLSCWTISGNQLRAQIQMPAYVVGAGATETADAKISMVGTFGQPMVGIVGSNSQGHVAGFWARVASGTSTEVEKLTGDEIPVQFELRGNYPNPFNPTTMIRFQLPERERVTLTIYNMLGKIVAVLVDTEMSAGDYRVTWDARDDIGNPVSSGTYLYRLESTNFSSVRMMTLLK